ncbi:hypothetical protein Purlil1_12186 [Purpureocillium lilacinum]|uniref:Uncharacterized protein n=1 Tax=Purpureocillium lilacinum TaxID=33203 RepID=A0ABR0BHL2_PURLI|nr:hypothetical protein Purlil1_12186 [Purpureocillium lilacinum]
MEAAGLVVGVAGLAGLFSTCLEVVDKVQSYQTSGTDSDVLDTRFNATRVLFERWGASVGNEKGRLLPDHHPVLDDNDAIETITGVLHILIKTLCDVNNARSDRIRAVGLGDDNSSGQTWPKSRYAAKPETTRRKMAWVLWRKKVRLDQVELFEKLVHRLRELVPSDIGGSTWRAHKQLTLGPSPAQTYLLDLQQILDRIDRRNRGKCHSHVLVPSLRREAETRRELHSWLGQGPQNERYHQALEERVDGTCDWILDRPAYRQWLAVDASTGPKLLWIHAPAGFGKTVLCAHLVKQLTSKLGTPVAHFFFTSDSEGHRDPYLALRSWISQLISLHADAYDHVHRIWESDINPTATHSTIITAFTELLRIVPGCTFAADGLDECAFLDDRSISVVKFLRTVADAIAETSTRILYVSRDEPQIRHALMNDTRQGSIEYKITPEDVRCDTTIYSQSIVDKKLSGQSDDVRATLSQTMSDRCHGQFLWLRMQDESLKSWMNEKQLHKAITNAPVRLDDLYNRNWDRIASLGKQEMLRAFALLRWTAFSLRPLTVCEITEAALIVQSEDFPLEDLPDHINHDYIDSEIIRPCGPLLEVRNDPADPSCGRQTVHLTHFSVRQFLLRRLPGPDWIQQNEDLRSSQEQLQNTLLAKACLTYASLRHVWEDKSKASSPSLGASFRDYAATTWYQQVSLGLPQDAVIMRLCMAFLNKQNPSWDCWRDLIDSQSADRHDKEAEATPPGPLYYAVKLRLTDLAIILADEHDVNETSTLGRSALGVASGNGCSEIVRVLLRKGADPKLADCTGCTPLHAASTNGHVKVVKLLLERGADVAVADKEGWTPLMYASLTSQVRLVKLLLEEGANVTVADKEGRTPLIVASTRGHVEVVVTSAPSPAAASSPINRRIMMCGRDGGRRGLLASEQQ